MDPIERERGGPPSDPTPLPFLEGGGEMGERTRQFDRSATPVGPSETWPQGPKTAVSPSRVLIADDNADMREYLVRLLETRYEIDAVGDGYAALDAARTRSPDLIVADVMMPGLDGFGLLAALRADEGLRTIPVIILSARAGEEARVEGIEAGADDYLVKPFSARELLARVEGNLRLQHARREAADARRAGEARIRGMANVEGVGILTFDATGTVIDANDAFLHMTGYTRQDVEARSLTWRRMTPPEFLAESEAQMAKLEQTGLIGPYEKEYLHADGSRTWLLFAGAALGDGTLVEYCIDVSDRKRAEAAARESDARFRAVVDLVPDLLWQSAPDGSTDWYNARWYEYTGQTPNDAAGSGWATAIHPDDRERSAANYARAAETGEPLRQEYRIRAARGGYRWFLVRAEPQRDEAGRIVRWFGAATDVHEQRVAMLGVERQVAERTVELRHAESTRDELRRQLASAEEAERRRLARELHDQLGQHLTAFALGLADARRLLEAGESAGQRLGQLEELAQLMTRDARYLALELRPPELDDVGLESALATYVENWGARYGVEADVAVTGAAAWAPIPTDISTAIYRIAQEALTNAARYADAKHVSVLLEKADDSVRLIVEDDGRGFDVAATHARARHERRLGLAGMRERAMIIGGTLDVESSRDGGTTVYAHLPLAAARFPIQSTPDRSGADGLPTPAGGRRRDWSALSDRAAAAIGTSLALAQWREVVMDTIRSQRRS